MEFGPVFQKIFQQRPTLPLISGSPLPLPVASLTLEVAFEHHPGNVQATFGKACVAAAYLYLDHWDTAHRLAQNLPTAEGSYWHAIIHRREPDYWNSKYWFRQVGDHPIFPELAEAVRALPQAETLAAIVQKVTANGRWDPFAFVDACEQASQQGDAMVQACEQIQMVEFQLLFKYCYQRATGTAKG